MMPAAIVPCPRQSFGSVLVTSRVRKTRPCSCGWEASTPLSTTATMTPEPRVSGQTSVKPRRCCAQGGPLISEEGRPACCNWQGGAWVFGGGAVTVTLAVTVFVGFAVGLGLGVGLVPASATGRTTSEVRDTHVPAPIRPAHLIEAFPPAAL